MDDIFTVKSVDSFLPLLLSLFLWGVVFLFSPHLSYADETIVVSIVLNYEEKGDFFVILTDSGDILVSEADLQEIGIAKPDGEVVEIEGERYMPLSSLKAILYRFDEMELSVSIIAPATIFEKQTVDLKSVKERRVYYPRHSSAFLNYGLNYWYEDSLSRETYTLTNQLGIRHKDLLFYTDTVYDRTDLSERFVRLTSNITYDRRDDLTRFVLGDFVASSGRLGSALNMGGLSFSKVFNIDPYFIKHPTLDVEGFVTLPSDYEVYLDGLKIRAGELRPGEFELSNIYHVAGAKFIEVVLRDPFGKETKIAYPYYFTDRALSEGLHEYGYNLGFIREEFGTESSKYGDAAFVGFHNYGLSDSFTVRAGMEATSGFFRVSPGGTYVDRKYGVVSFSLSTSRDDGQYGYAGSVNYSFAGKRIGANLFANRYTEDYALIGTRNSTQRTKYEAGGGISYGTRKTGHLSAGLSTSEDYSGRARREGSISYTFPLRPNLVMVTRLRRIKEEDTADEIFFALNYYPRSNIFVSASASNTDERDTRVFQAQKTIPLGEGYGGRLYYQEEETGGATTRTLNPNFQYNSRFGIYRVDYTGESREAYSRNTYRLTASGALVYVGRKVGFVRPVSDSFGLVRLGELEGIRVYVNNQDIGTTDSRGFAFIPDMNSYHDNEVRVEDKDVPMDYYMPEAGRHISPPYRSGSCVNFALQKVQAFIGTLSMKDGDIVEPIEFSRVRMAFNGTVISTYTGRDGEFYIENYTMEEEEEALPSGHQDGDCSFEVDAEKIFPPGRYGISLRHMGKACSLDLEVPDTDEMFVELGDLVCVVE